MTNPILAPHQENTQPRTDVLAVPAAGLPWLTPERAAEIVDSWTTDPIDHWRRQQKKFDRVWLKTPAELPPRMVLAAGAVQRVATRLEALGYTVEPTAGNASWDLLIDGCLRVEVKASEWREQMPGKDRRLPRHRYQANIRARQAKSVDLIIFVAVNGSDHHFIIPREQLNGRHSLTIRTHNPVNYTGCLAEFREAWQLVGPALKAAKERREVEQGRLPL